MSTYGRVSLESVGRGIQVTADGAPKAKAGGVTIEWAAVVAATADANLSPIGEGLDVPSDDFVYTGEKYLRYGQIVCKLVGGTSAGKYVPYGATSGLGGGTVSTTAKGDWYILNQTVHEGNVNSDHPPAIEGGLLWRSRLKLNIGNVRAITIPNDNTGGSFTITYDTTATGGGPQTTAALAYNASALAVQGELQMLSNLGPATIGVSLVPLVAGTQDGVYTITVDSPQPIGTFTTTPSLTGGTNTAAVTSPSTSTVGPSLADFNTAFPTATFVTE